MSNSLEIQVLDTASGARADAVEAFLDRCTTSFAQQTIAWREVISPLGPDEPFHLVCRVADEVVGVLPAYRYAGPLGSILTSGCQAGALGGIACDAGQLRERVYEKLLASFLDLAKQLGCALATVLSNPFWPDDGLCERLLEPDLMLKNRCQVLDLEHAVDASGCLLRASSTVRRNLKKAQAANLVIDEDQTETNVEEWYELHALRHQEIGVTPLPKAMFAGALKTMIPRDKGRFFFVRQNANPRRMVAGGFYVYHGRVIDALMPSMRTDAARMSPIYFLAAHTIRWAKRRGLKYYNWQASPPSGGVVRFKRQWGSEHTDYSFLTRVTGDTAAFTRSTPEIVQDAYRWHYVLPFDRIGTELSAQARVSTREGAWNAVKETAT